MELDNPAVIAEARAVFDRYEAAIAGNDNATRQRLQLGLANPWRCRDRSGSAKTEQ